MGFISYELEISFREILCLLLKGHYVEIRGINFLAEMKYNNHRHAFISF